MCICVIGYYSFSGPSEGPAAKRVCQPGDLTVPATAMAAATAMTDKVPCSDNQQGNGATTETEHVPPEEVRVHLM